MFVDQPRCRQWLNCMADRESTGYSQVRRIIDLVLIVNLYFLCNILLQTIQCMYLRVKVRNIVKGFVGRLERA